MKRKVLVFSNTFDNPGHLQKLIDETLEKYPDYEIYSADGSIAHARTYGCSYMVTIVLEKTN